jgi:hypothetical protein
MKRAHNEVHVEQLIGRVVLDTAGRRVGRIAEVIARKADDEFVVASYIVGPVAWIHRFAVAGLGLRMRGLGQVYRVAWDQMDLSDAEHPRVTAPREELARDVIPHRKRGLTRRPARRLA